MHDQVPLVLKDILFIKFHALGYSVCSMLKFKPAASPSPAGIRPLFNSTPQHTPFSHHSRSHSHGQMSNIRGQFFTPPSSHPFENQYYSNGGLHRSHSTPQHQQQHGYQRSMSSGRRSRFDQDSTNRNTPHGSRPASRDYHDDRYRDRSGSSQRNGRSSSRDWDQRDRDFRNNSFDQSHSRNRSNDRRYR